MTCVKPTSYLCKENLTMGRKQDILYCRSSTCVMESTKTILLLCVVLALSGSNGQGPDGSPVPQTPHRFQADKFLDMLGKSYDSNLAYADLLSALQRRLNLDPASQTNSSTSTADGLTISSNAMAETTANCQEAPPKKGASITYTSESHVLGSRALYQCEAGYSGRSKFIQCLNGGQWSPSTGWEGCIPADCGPAPPGVTNADTSFTTTTFGSAVLYSCQSGYKMNVTNANVTCLDTGFWETPTFACEKANNMPNPMMAAFLQSMSGLPGMPSLPNVGLASNPSVLPSTSNGNNPMAAMFAQMFPNMAGQLPPVTSAPTTTTTTTVKPTVAVQPGGFQLPNHLQNLLPHGLSGAAGIRPENLMTLLSAGLGSANPAAAPRDLNQLLGSMNPMSVFGQSMGMGMGGLNPGGAATGPGGAPLDPERMAEQREEMMMRAMMANAMKSMMGPAGQAKPSNNVNPATDIMSLMALQSGLSGGGGGMGGAGAGGAGFDPLSMMFGGMNLFGQA